MLRGYTSFWWITGTGTEAADRTVETAGLSGLSVKTLKLANG
jgi:hypothetical protein